MSTQMISLVAQERPHWDGAADGREFEVGPFTVWVDEFHFAPDTKALVWLSVGVGREDGSEGAAEVTALAFARAVAEHYAYGFRVPGVPFKALVTPVRHVSVADRVH